MEPSRNDDGEEVGSWGVSSCNAGHLQSRAPKGHHMLLGFEAALHRFPQTFYSFYFLQCSKDFYPLRRITP
jgi:hypothetical protein